MNLRHIILLMIYILPYISIAQESVDDNKYIIGEWYIPSDGKAYKLVFNEDGTLYEYDEDTYKLLYWSFEERGAILKIENPNNKLETNRYVIHALDFKKLNIRYIREGFGFSEIAYYVKLK